MICKVYVIGEIVMVLELCFFCVFCEFCEIQFEVNEENNDYNVK